MMTSLCRLKIVAAGQQSPSAIRSSSSSSWLDSATSYLSKAAATLDDSNTIPSDIPLDTGNAAEVLISNRVIQTHHLQRLLSHDALAIHVKGFYPSQTIASAIGQQLAKQALDGKARNWKVMRQQQKQRDNSNGSEQRGMESTDVMTIGQHDPYNIAVANGTTNHYFNSVKNEFHHRRQPESEILDELLLRNNQRGSASSDSLALSSTSSIIPPVSILWPLDQVRLELDEAWPGGAGLARQKQEQQQGSNDERTSKHTSSRVFGGGLPRIMMGPTRWKHGLVHVDQFGPLSPDQGLFSANIYLQLPKTKTDNQTEANKDGESGECSENETTTSGGGGVLEIWPLGIRTQWEWYKNAALRQALADASTSAEIQYKLRSWLGPPQVITDVSPGDLILLCAQRPHAAVGFATRDVRVSLQCFIQHHGPGERLLIDC